MAEKKTGPVKPPIIDATARPSDKDKPAPESTTAETAKTSQKPEPAQATPKSAQATKPDPKPTSGSGVTGTASDDKPKPSPAKAGSEAGTAAKAEQPSALAALPLVPLAATAGAGALVGLALAYGLASFGYWPQPGQAPDLSQFDARATRLESAIASREAESEQIADRINGLEAQIAGIEPASTEGLAAQADLDAMTGQIGELSLQ